VTKYNAILSTQIAEPSTVENNDSLYQRIRAGDASARAEMIESNMALVLSKANSHVRIYPSTAYLFDDLVSAGCIGLIEAVDHMAAGVEVKTPTAYIRASICHSFGPLLETEAPIRVSRWVQQRLKADGKESQIPRVRVAPLESHEVKYEATGQDDVLDMIESCCTTPLEHTVVQMRIEGHSDRQIAAATGLSRSAVQAIRHRLHGSYAAKEEALAEKA
jgi:RNA polymerase sigma factor (sigma-70 family)